MVSRLAFNVVVADLACCGEPMEPSFVTFVAAEASDQRHLREVGVMPGDVLELVDGQGRTMLLLEVEREVFPVETPSR